MSQLKNMFHSVRIFATIGYLATLILTLSVAFAYNGGGKTLLIIICIIMQLLALIWYTLSYIPFARDMVVKVCASCTGMA